jgi:hypothetical protein
MLNDQIMNRYYLLILFPVLLGFCNRVDDPKVQFCKWVQKGTVVDKVTCKSDPGQSYCLYLPSTYDDRKSYPTIYAFDPHGKGRIPVVLMKNIAEKLGYIIIGSNNTRNGLSAEEINSIVASLFADTKLKISIDPNRIYLTGFSGGGRVACMIAQQESGIKGVIACSGSLQPNAIQLSYHFIGIAGTQDMNYLEMKQLNSLLNSMQVQNQLIVFRGKHQWPSEHIMTEAIEMLELYSIRDTPSSEGRDIINEYLSTNLKRIESLSVSDDPDSLAEAYMISRRTHQMLNGLADVERVTSMIDMLAKNPILQQFLKDQVELEKFELQKQKEYSGSLGSKDEKWWNVEIRSLRDGTSGLTDDVSKRLLAYVSLNCYGYVNGALNYKDWNAAKYFTTIYRLVDPENPDSWYALACLQANTGKSDDALESLKGAIRFGLSDFSKIQNDPLLYTLHGLPEFNRIVTK